MKKNKKNRYKVGYYILDPYTQQRQVDMKGLSLEDAEKSFKEAIRKYR